MWLKFIRKMTDMYKDCDVQLVPFLREFADSIESKKLPPEKLKHVGEFFMNYKYYEEHDDGRKEDEFDDMDIVRFLTAGWWIYTHILKDKIDVKTDHLFEDIQQIALPVLDTRAVSDPSGKLAPLDVSDPSGV